VQESVECENHPGLAESTVDVGLVAVAEDLDGGRKSGGVVRNRVHASYQRLYLVVASGKNIQTGKLQIEKGTCKRST
jgi:hypothetical protein